MHVACIQQQWRPKQNKMKNMRSSLLLLETLLITLLLVVAKSSTAKTTAVLPRLPSLTSSSRHNKIKEENANLFVSSSVVGQGIIINNDVLFRGGAIVRRSAKETVEKTAASPHLSLPHKRVVVTNEKLDQDENNSNDDEKGELISNSSSSPNKMKNKKGTMMVLLGSMTGFSGVLCKRRFGCYAGIMTGNLARLANAIADQHWSDALWYTSLVSGYIGGIVVYRLMDIHSKKQRREQEESTSLQSSGIPSLMIPAFVTAFVCADLVDWSSGIPSKHMMPLLAFALAMINAWSMDSSYFGSVTNAATGHLTRAALGAVDSIHLGIPLQGADSYRFVASFFATVLIVSAFLNLTRQLHLARPPMGLLLGVLYTLVLFWYSGTSPSSLLFGWKQACQQQQNKIK